MDFSGEEIVFTLLVVAVFTVLFLWSKDSKRKKLASIEQTTYELWMDYDNVPSEGGDSEDVYRTLREKYLENLKWASRTFGVMTCVIKDDLVGQILDDRNKFNYKATYYLFRYPSHMPTCFRGSDFKHSVSAESNVGWGTKGAELFMMEFNEKIEEIKNFRETNSLEIKYGYSDIYPEYVLKNCVEGCTKYSKSGYLEFCDVKSEILPRLLKEEKWQKFVYNSGWNDGDKKWETGRVMFSG